MCHDLKQAGRVNQVKDRLRLIGMCDMEGLQLIWGIIEWCAVDSLITKSSSDEDALGISKCCSPLLIYLFPKKIDNDNNYY